MTKGCVCPLVVRLIPVLTRLQCVELWCFGGFHTLAQFALVRVWMGGKLAPHLSSWGTALVKGDALTQGFSSCRKWI